MVDQEMEEVQYPIGHEIAWLNEHMAEIFSQNQLSVDPAQAIAASPSPPMTDSSVAILQRYSRPQGSYGVRRHARRGSRMRMNLEWYVPRLASWPLID